MRAVFIVILISIFSLSLADPNPKPIPGLDVKKMEGTWYVVLQSCHYRPESVSCWKDEISVDSRKQHVIIDSYLFPDSSMTSESEKSVYTVQSNQGVWTHTAGDVTDIADDWIAVDLVNYQWATMCQKEEACCYIYSRTTTLEQSIIDAQIALCEAQGFDMKNAKHINNSIHCHFSEDPSLFSSSSSDI